MLLGGDYREAEEMRRTKVWWSMLSPEERSELIRLERIDKQCGLGFSQFLRRHDLISKADIAVDRLNDLRAVHAWHFGIPAPPTDLSDLPLFSGSA